MRPTSILLVLTFVVLLFPVAAVGDALIDLWAIGQEPPPTVKSGDAVIEFEVFYDQAALDELGLSGVTAFAESQAQAKNKTILESGGAFFQATEIRLVKVSALPEEVVLPENASEALGESRLAAMDLRDPRTDFVLTVSGADLSSRGKAFLFTGFAVSSYAIVRSDATPDVAVHEWGHVMGVRHDDGICWQTGGSWTCTVMAVSTPDGAGFGRVEQFSYPSRQIVEENWFAVAAFGASNRCVESVCLNKVSGLVVPGFLVEVDSPDGPTTLVAVRNASDEHVTATIGYHAETVLETPVWSEDVELAPQATYTWDVRGKLTNLGGLPVVDGQIQGLIVITESGTTTASNLVGDYFLVDFANDFATGGRMGERPTVLCDHEEIRFVEFGSGVRLRIILDEPNSFTYSAYAESGEVLVKTTTYETSSHLTLLDLTDLVTGANFGTLVFDFSASGGGSVTAKYEAFGRFSVTLPGECRE